METETKKRAAVPGLRLPAGLRRQNAAVLGTLLIICAITAIMKPIFVDPSNLINVMKQVAILGVVACGQSMLMISGGIDLSVGTLVSLSGVIVGKALVNGYGQGIAITVGIAVGGLVGLVNGIIVARTRVQPFISTLGMMSVLQGLALLVTNGRQIPNLRGQVFEPIGGGMVGFVPVPVIILLAVVLLSYFLLRHTKYGRHLYAIGGNEETAYLSGISVNAHKIIVYSITGLLTGLASVMLTSRIGAAIPLMGTGYELQSIAAVVIGGVALAGGRGTMFGAFLGVLLLGVISNSLNLLNVSSFYQNIAVGMVILVAVIANQYAQRH